MKVEVNKSQTVDSNKVKQRLEKLTYKTVYFLIGIKSILGIEITYKPISILKHKNLSLLGLPPYRIIKASRQKKMAVLFK
jgi:hypothetical protein